ncbi:uncharacterized protein LOC106161990 [Lingula anatina]|uniref:Uncharacterized protein LOC106161990 n=1 Tax=Lingula anatina TaxID=7574 RepID=A0A1S3IAU5_LINAN|nr:uncharacterized protein LOC106161990 [Lingula anatina]|eukprot:XP_013394529.1 uncharacterized protein LOC106161990 [Lingula anatina]
MASHQERITPSDAVFFSNNVDTSNLSENTTKILFHSSSSSTTTTTTTTTTVPAGGVFELNTTAPLDINAVKSATVDTSSELQAQRHGALSAGLKRPGMSQKRELMGMISEKHARDAVMALVGSKANNNKNETLLSASVLEATQSFDVSVNSLMSGSLPRDLETTTNLSEGSTMFNNPGDHSCVGYYGAASVPDTNDSLASGDGSVKVVNENSTGLNTAMGDMLNDSRGLAEIKNIHSNFSNAHNCLDMETMLPPGCLVENKSVQAFAGRTAVGDDNNMIPECPCPTDIDVSTNSNHIRGTLYTPHTAVGSTHCVGTLHLSVKATDVTIFTNCDDGSLAESTAVTSCIEKKGKEGIAVQGSDAIVDNTPSSVDNTPQKGIKVDTENVPVQGGLVSTRPYSYGDPKQLPLVSAHWAAEQSQQQNIGALSPNSAAAAASACGNGQGGSEITRVTNSCQLKMSVTFPEAAGLGQPQQQNWSLESDSALLDAESHELPQGDDTESDTRDSEMETINLNIATGASTPNELIDGCEVEESDTQSSLLEHGTENLPIATGGSGSCLLPGSDNPFLTSVISTSPPTLTGVSHSVSRSTTSLVTTQAAGSAALASVLSSVSASPPYTLPTNIICTSTVTDLMAAAAVANSPYPLTGNLPAVIPMSNSMLGLGPLTANVAGLLPTGTNNALTSIPFLIGCVPPNMPTVLPTNLIPLLAGGGGQALVGVPVSQMTAAMATSIQPTTQDPMNKQLLESPPQQHHQQLASQMMPQDQNKHIPSLSTVTNMITLTNSSSNHGSSNFTASAHLAAMATGSGPQSDVTMATNTAAVTFTTSTPVMQALLNAPPVIARVLPNDNALFHPGSSVPMATNDMSTPPPPRITASAVTPLPMTVNTVSKELNAENVPPTPSTPLSSSLSVIGSSSNVISMEDVSTGAVTMTMGEEGCSTGEKNTQETVPVPFGWSRHLENGAVTYYR